MNEIEFVKLQGLGNDFLVVPVADVATLALTPDETRLLCDRRFGVGADGIVFVSRSNSAAADFASRIFNSDGSEAGISGNGTRCAAAYLFHRRLWTDPIVR
ncbi:MAG TPA: diaminopimelate epimerase, partial [Blastocatellia bacterium]|nr:diaminopimelate epimerase [Blastocatellia bacterium]